MENRFDVKIEDIQKISRKSITPKIFTLTFPIQITSVDDVMVLMGMKKRGFGVGKYNGFGGKIEPGEDILKAAVREMKEECGLEGRPESMRFMGVLSFLSPIDTDATVYVFVCDEFKGEPKNTDEMSIKWFCEDDVPYDMMWADDIHWLPYILRGKEVTGVFAFRDGDTMDHLSLSIGRMRPSENKFHNPVTGSEYEVKDRLSDDPNIKSLWKEPSNGDAKDVTIVPKYLGCTCGSHLCMACAEDPEIYKVENGFYPLRNRFDSAQDALEAGFKEEDE